MTRAKEDDVEKTPKKTKGKPLASPEGKSKEAETPAGNLEDAILKVNQKDESGDSTYHNMLLENVKFDALVNKIKRESSEKRVKNQIWLVFETDAGESNSNSSVISPATDFEKKPINIPRFVAAEKRQRKSSMFEPS
ncbi:hypothetical protein GEV33_003175 [Tenebrio molitor]|uniref:Uncharacterized protein n=1 Tax=Tenebrio molitor TaxID=7067 RepID=A0A8J6HS29_TENMO|nr:hypothetical protein GEV33_003175 [Tenebrio molitor]